MKINIDDIKASPTALDYVENVDDLNQRLGRGAREYRVDRGLDVHLTHYKSGLDIFFDGTVQGAVRATCARCLGEFDLPLDDRFSIVLTPRSADVAKARLTPDDLALSSYEGEEIDLAPLMHEQAILALPTIPLCAEGCRGLCSRCGADLNAGPCGCPPPAPDPRLAPLRALARGT
jgi:uncharacterized protein